jgi:hypothetical protein
MLHTIISFFMVSPADRSMRQSRHRSGGILFLGLVFP